jgi:hypothetical protein
VEKPTEEFSTNKKSKDWKESRCKECVNNYNKEYYINNGEYVCAHVKNYRESNPLVIKLRKKKYHEENKERLNEISRDYHAKNREELNKYGREKYQRNKERYKETVRRYLNTPEGRATKSRAWNNRRSKNKNIKNTLTANQWNIILHMQQNNKCAHCGHEFSDKLKPTKDHIIPLHYKWFGLTFGNVQALCKSCNSKKNKKFNIANAIDNILVNA